MVRLLWAVGGAVLLVLLIWVVVNRLERLEEAAAVNAIEQLGVASSH